MIIHNIFLLNTKSIIIRIYGRKGMENMLFKPQATLTFNTITLGFTLAEVLITIMIVGTIAATCIPSLISSTNDTEYKSATKKKFAEIQTVFNKINIENGGSYRCSYINGANPIYDECSQFYTDFTLNFNVTKTCNPGGPSTFGICLPLGGILNQDGTEKDASVGGFNLSHQSGSFAFVLNDTSYVFVYYGASSKWPIFAIDVNGQKGPNRWGKDVYSFWVDNYTLKNYTGGYSAVNILQN